MFSALVSLVTGYLQARAISKIGSEVETYADQWFRLIASVLITIIVTFPATWGSVALAQYANGISIYVSLGIGFASALLGTALIVYILWTTNPLTKGIRIVVPSWIANKAVEQNITTTERK